MDGRQGEGTSLLAIGERSQPGDLNRFMENVVTLQLLQTIKANPLQTPKQKHLTVLPFYFTFLYSICFSSNI